MPTLFFEAPARTSERTFSVSGVTERGKEVLIYLDDQLLGSTTAKKDGTYSFNVSLPESSTVDSWYTLRAVWSDNSEISATQKVLLKSDVPKLVQFDMKAGKFSYDLLAFSGAKKVITWYDTTLLQFTIRFENPENLAKVYVTSTKNGITRRLRATATETPGLYIATAPFEGTTRWYQPGTLDVAYTEITTEEDVCQAQPLPDALKNATVDVVADTDAEYHAVVTAEGAKLDIHSQTLSVSGLRSLLLPDAPQAQAMRTADVDSEDIEIVESILKDYAKAYGGEVISNAKDTLTYQSEDQDVFYYILWDSASNAAFTTSVKVVGTLAISEASAVEWATAKSAWGAIATGSTDVLQGYFDAVRIKQAAKDIKAREDAREISPQEAVYAINQITKIHCAYGALRVGHFVLSMASAGLIKSAVAGLCLTGPAGIVAGAAMTLLASYMLNSVTDLAENYLDASLAYYVSGNQGSSIKWMTDPSGYVCDADTGSRLSGVTATAYWIENDDSETFWDTPPSADQYGVLWDSQEYSNQQNPLVTDQDGCYAWVVPDGWWRVKYEKEGYETAWSDWMTVPPEQTDVNIGLKPIAPEYAVRAEAVTADHVSVRVTSGSAAKQTARCVLAAYDTDGRLTAAAVQTLSPGSEAALTLSGLRAGGTVKLFILNSTTGEPLRRSWSSTLQAA